MAVQEFKLEATLEAVHKGRKKPARLVFSCDSIGTEDYGDLNMITEGAGGGRVVLRIAELEPPLPEVAQKARGITQEKGKAKV